MLKKIYYLAALALLTICVGSTVSAQDASVGTAILKSANGFLLIDNNRDLSYSIEFKGNEIKPLESDNPMFVIDNQTFQMLVVNQTEFVPKDKQAVSLTNEQVLEFHKVWETDYLAKAINAKLSPSSEIIELPASRKIMIWSFPMPKEIGSQFTYQLFTSTVIGKSILAVNSSLEKESDLSKYKAYIKTVFQTLKTSNTPIDVKKVSEELRKQSSGK